MKQDKGFVAISAIWYERYLECSRTCRTAEFPDSVWRFYFSLLNLDKDDLAVKDKVDTFLNDIWHPKIQRIVKNNCRDTTDGSSIDLEHRLVEAQYIHELFTHIIQTIQDSGIGWMIPNEIQQYMITQE